jgi:hypothetical protein
MIVNIQATRKGTDFQKDEVDMVNMPRIGEAVILPKIGYMRVKDIEHDYTVKPTVTTLFLG